MKLALTEVYEVATFYAHFDVVKEGETPPPAVTVRVCDSLSCAMAGAEHLLRDLPARLGRDVRVVRAPCMGACDRAPVCAVGHAQVMHATVDSVAAAAAHGRARACLPRRRKTSTPTVRDGGYKLLEGLHRRHAHARRRHQDGERRRPARARRRRLSHRPQMDAGARRAGAAAVCGQCRRGRAGHLQGPLLPRARSAPLHRGHADRRLGGRRARHLHLHPRRISRGAAAAGAGARQGRAGRARQPQQASSSPRRRRLYLRRRVGDDRVDRGQARAAAPSPALRGASRPVRSAHARAERRDALLGARHHREGRGVVHLAWPPRAQGLPQLLGLRPGEASPAWCWRRPASPRAS